ncbi:MAG: HIT family protein [bacterium]|nr:HIT family protein [bacterium]
MKKCFFCALQIKEERKCIIENKTFFVIYDDYPVSKGHCLIVSKRHLISFFDLTKEQLQDFFTIIKGAKEIVQNKFQPSAFNIGINEGREAGRTVDHLHIHLIPRYRGDVANPVGGVRNVIPWKGDYTKFSHEK